MRKALNLPKIAIHSLICVGFILFPLIASPRSSVFQTLHFGPPEVQGLINSALLITFFYFNYLIIIPGLSLRKHYFKWLTIIFVAYVAIILLPETITSAIGFDSPPPFHKEGIKPPHREHDLFRNFMRKYQFQESTLKFLLILTLSFLLSANKKWKQYREEKRKAELSYLKSQVNPHFLFNTLNGIYALSMIEPEKTPVAIIKLSELMRYVISEIKNDLVPLNNEIDYLQNYIDLQMMRLGKTVEIIFKVDTTTEDYKIAPLILIPFVENAFKYGISSESASIINISLSVNEAKLTFRVSNKKVQNETNEGTNTGLENVKRRLEISYPQAHNLKITEYKDSYIVELQILLKQ